MEVMTDLVKRLSHGRHPILAARAKSPEDLKASIERGFVLLKFTDTQGGTEVGVELDKARCVLDDADFAGGRGRIRLVGQLMLDYDQVELSAEIDLATLQGEGNLMLIADEATWRAAEAKLSGESTSAH